MSFEIDCIKANNRIKKKAIWKDLKIFSMIKGLTRSLEILLNLFLPDYVVSFYVSHSLEINFWLLTILTVLCTLRL